MPLETTLFNEDSHSVFLPVPLSYFGMLGRTFPLRCHCLACLKPSVHPSQKSKPEIFPPSSLCLLQWKPPLQSCSLVRLEISTQASPAAAQSEKSDE